MDSIVFDKSFSVEEIIKLEKLQEIDNLYLKIQKTQEETSKETQEETSKEELTINQLEHLDLDLLRVGVNNTFNQQIEKIKKLLGFQVYTLYSEYFKEFDIVSNYYNILLESKSTDDLISNQFLLKWGYVSQKLNTFKNIFNIKYIMYMEDYLFFWNLRDIKPQYVMKLAKVKVRKWKLKKKKIKKLYILKKIKKFMFFKKWKRSHYNEFFQCRTFFTKIIKPSKNILVKKIPISSRVISQYNLDFFYKLNKTIKLDLQYTSKSYTTNSSDNFENFTIYLRNFHQKPYLKFRKARILHWNFFFKKTLRKQRYKGFFLRFIKKYKHLSYDYTFFVNFFTRFCISWSRTNKLSSFYKNILIEKNNQVVKLPIFFSKIFKWKYLKKKNYILKKKIGRWSFLNFKRSKYPWLQKKKNSPKSIDHSQPNTQTLSYLSQWDPMTGFLHLDYKVKGFIFPVTDDFKTNYQIKLHMYRYKANN